MNYQIIALVLASGALWGYIPAQSQANTPQGDGLQIAPMNSKITLGEPLILKYTVTNSESQTMSANIDEDAPKWLNASIVDAAGHVVRFVADTDAIRRHGGVSISPHGSYHGYFVIGRKLEPTHSGQYTLNISVHMISSWPDDVNENFVNDQNHSFPITVTAKDPKRLQATAEVLRQNILHDKNVGEVKAAVKALFSLPQPECQSIWRELAVDPSLDAFVATDVINQLAAIQNVTTSDILADMDAVAPERWSRTGTSPSSALLVMRQTANPELKQHINALIAGADAPADNRHLGEVN